MRFLKSIFKALGTCISYINTYFKTFVFLFIVFLILIPSTHSNISPANLEKLELKGAIDDISALLEKLIKLKNDENIKGVLLLIDSPGGAFAPSMELALAIEDLKAKKPVVVYANGTMASGSYLAAVSANTIIANPASFIGSIGVIIQGVDLSELGDKIGIKTQTLKAGEYKEIGTFSREWTAKEKEFLQGLITQSYELFTDFVASKRKLKLEEKDKWANARIFLAKEALELALIDEIGNLNQAQERLIELSGVKQASWAQPDKLEKLLDKLSASVASFLNTLAQKMLLNSNQIQVH